MNNDNYILDQFKFKHEGKANEQAMFCGKTYRITVLTSRLFRLEYNENSVFEDRPSQAFWYRHQEVPVFEVKDTDTTLEIITEYWHLIYKKEQPFSRNSLKIKKCNDKSGDSVWYYGMEEKGNLKGTYRTLDRVSGKLKLEDGLISKSGFVVVDDSHSLVYKDNGWIENRQSGQIDLYYFGYGQDYKACISDYYKVSGKTPLLPRFVLGNWWSRYWDYSDKELKELIGEFEERSIPLSVCILDMDWHVTDIPKEYGRGWTGYTWEKSSFPDPKKFLDWLKVKKLKTALNLHPALGILGHEKVYEEVADFMGVENKDPVGFDISDPKFMNAYFTKVHHPIENIGVDFWWMDWQQGKESAVEGLDPLWMLNHLHFLDSAKDENKRPFIFSRWPGLGGHRYPIGFSGDTHVTWESLSFQPYFTSTATNVGYGWWSHDIGGHYKGHEEPELYTRWVQYGVFSPIMRLHSTNSYYHKREPWRWNKEVEYIVTKFMQLRHKLIPYLYTMSKRNEDGGMPLVTPMYYEYPKEEQAYQFKNQYYFGSELLVSPFVTPTINNLNQSQTEVWLPIGLWFDFFNGEVYSGDNTYNIYGTLRDIPVFAKAGAIIPLTVLTEENQIDNPTTLELQVFPAASNSFELYEDDGMSLQYKKGNFALTNFNLDYTNKSMKFSIETQGDVSVLPENRQYKIHFRSITDKVNIICSNEFEHTYNHSTNTLVVTIKQLKKDERIEISLISQAELLIKEPFDHIQKIMDLLEHSSYDSILKDVIGFKYASYKKAKKGILAKNTSKEELIRSILSLDMEEDLRKAILAILTK